MTPSPIDNTALVMVVHNEENHLRTLLPYLRPWFSEIVIGVQDSTDETPDLAKQYADVVVPDICHGYGDATLPMVQQRVTRTWCLRVDADERPQRRLLESLHEAPAYCLERNLDGLWLPFRSWIDGVEWKQPHNHLRFWANRVIWPSSLHSRPMTDATESWPIGFMEHKKTLDEHVVGYLTYLAKSGQNAGWIDHNMLQLRSAIANGVGNHGWADIESRPWWPDALAAVYGGNHPGGREDVPPPQQ